MFHGSYLHVSILPSNLSLRAQVLAQAAVERPVQLLVVVAAVPRLSAPPTLSHLARVLLLHAALRVVADPGILSLLLRFLDTVCDFILGSESAS